MSDSEIKKYLVTRIKKLRKNLHDFDKPTFREGYDKGKHAALSDLLNEIDPVLLKSLPSS